MTLSERLPDDFSRTLLAAAEQALSGDNPLRFQHFSATLRELFTYLLHHYAPDDEVKACQWFEQARDTDITRRQRAKYATQGGLSDSYLEQLNVDVDDLHSEAIRAIHRLNSATHVRAETLQTDPEKIELSASEAMDALDGLIYSFYICRSVVTDALESQVYDGILEVFVNESIGEIDIVAGGGYEVSPFISIESVHVESITSSTIGVRVEGEAPVRLSYGPSNDSAEIDHDFPFSMKFLASTETPDNLHLDAYEVDNSSWFG